jgi:hypothetical protein
LGYLNRAKTLGFSPWGMSSYSSHNAQIVAEQFVRQTYPEKLSELHLQENPASHSFPEASSNTQEHKNAAPLANA